MQVIKLCLIIHALFCLRFGFPDSAWGRYQIAAQLMLDSLQDLYRISLPDSNLSTKIQRQQSTSALCGAIHGLHIGLHPEHCTGLINSLLANSSEITLRVAYSQCEIMIECCIWLMCFPRFQGAATSGRGGTFNKSMATLLLHRSSIELQVLCDREHVERACCTETVSHSPICSVSLFLQTCNQS